MRTLIRGKSVEFFSIQHAGFDKVLTDAILLRGLAREERRQSGVVQVPETHRALAKSFVALSASNHVRDLKAVEESCLTGDLSQHRSLAPLPGNSVDEGGPADAMGVIEEFAEGQRPVRDSASPLTVLGSRPRLGLGLGHRGPSGCTAERFVGPIDRFQLIFKLCFAPAQNRGAVRMDRKCAAAVNSAEKLIVEAEIGGGCRRAADQLFVGGEKVRSAKHARSVV